ncbi:ABC transporter permease [Leptolyngbya ohadii]|uniref:ABC transporter permease n=2 Tax=Leptolyngbya ohadii TaxID=1962290 RepID=UPI00117BA3A5|nr:ABC transporter permease [Leptolyngbya ohadii]
MPKLSQSTVYQTGAIALSLVFIAIVILLVGGSPIEVLTNMSSGAFGTPDQMARVVMTLVPLILCTCGLLFTFTAGLYNLGIEGQISAGAIASMIPIRLFENTLPPFVVIVLAILAGILGGALWGLFAGVLNVYGRINEIFAGLGLNFVADGLAIYLIFGPWKRSGVASMSGTEQFNESLWLPTFGNTQASPIALILALLVLAATIVVMRGTYFGLKLKAVGQNLRASYVLGIPSVRQLLSAFAICGACAGLAGALQVLAVFHRLIPTVSSNLGYLSLLIAMLIGSNAWLILPIGKISQALEPMSMAISRDR